MSRNIFGLLLVMLLAVPGVYAATFRASIAGSGTWNDAGTLKILPNTEFQIEVYCLNNDTVMPPPYVNRVTWSSPFTFTGEIPIQWLDVFPDSVFVDDYLTTAKFTTWQFLGFWDFLRGIYSESRDGTLPDRFNFTGASSALGYPPELGEIKILSWRAKTTADSGQICIEQGDMLNDIYDWFFDPPVPTFPTSCWTVQINPDDRDNDGIPNASDNCPDAYNPGQENADGDAYGDVCDPCPYDSLNDIDQDGFCADVDNCPLIYNPDQLDSNSNGVGDVCEYTCGDVNKDTNVNVLDLNYLIMYLFRGGPAPDPLGSADVNCDTNHNVLDASFMINFLYKAGPPLNCCGV